MLAAGTCVIAGFFRLDCEQMFKGVKGERRERERALSAVFWFLGGFFSVQVSFVGREICLVSLLPFRGFSWYSPLKKNKPPR